MGWLISCVTIKLPAAISGPMVIGQRSRRLSISDSVKYWLSTVLVDSALESG